MTKISMYYFLFLIFIISFFLNIFVAGIGIS